ncbi:ABC transporter permease [Amycolatopsis magusensis]|uniref:ABC-2 type transport system permease protein n=1 Tax=Amycolatopsis magusensis TaxID=882444 RepID=A0ABS4PLT1_9PSEU|nr:ABC transporter permease [Amycolatopsis magusensis]MBP2180394.1 ABC-2 type transport system permease protein [Amycolatopsis magusensis]
MTMMVRHGWFEIRLLFRRKLTLFSATVMPIGLCVLTWFGVRDRQPENWGSLLGDRFTMLMLLSVFMTSMTIYTARRQSLVLKRLRTTELTDAGVIGAITMPVVAMGVVQALAYFVFCLFLGAPMPTHPWLVVLGMAGGVLLTVTAGMATAALSKSVEATHVTSFPVMIGALAGLFMVGSGDEQVATAGSLMPLIGPSNLLAKGWSGFDTGFTPLTVDLGSTLLWGVLFAAVIGRFFRWEPRT